VQWELGKDISDVDSEMYWGVDLLEKRGILGDDLTHQKIDGVHPLKSENELLAKHTQGKCFFLMEYSHAMGNSGGNFAEYWDIFYKYDSLCGGCIWEWVDHGVFRPTGKVDKRTGLAEMYVSHGGDSYEYPNDGPFCNDGIVRNNRKPSPYLMEAAHVMRGIKVVKEDNGNLKIKNHYAFSNANEFDGVWECVADGVVIRSGSFDVPSVAPLTSGDFDFDFGKAIPRNVDLSRSEVFFNFRFLTKSATDLVPAKWPVSSNQVRISDFVRPEFSSDGAEELVVDDYGQTLSVSCGRTTAIFSKKQGTLLKLFMKGVDVISSPNPSLPGGPKLTTFRAFVDNDSWLKFDYINSGLMTCNYHAEPIEVISNGVKVITRITSYKSAMFIHEAIWEFSKDGSIVIKNKVTPFGAMPVQLPRLGLSFRLNPSLESMRYYGRGPWENYIDRSTSAFFGRWDSTVTDQFEAYSKPQDNGYKTDVRYVEFFNPGGRGVRFESDEPMFMQALHYESLDMYLSRNNAVEFKRVNPIRSQKEIFLNLDVRQCGLGQASCGSRPLEKYRFDLNKQVEWKIKISPAKKQ
jgi:beta-galactosidase/beta-glucuronidase